MNAVVVPGDPADRVIFPDGSRSDGSRPGRVGGATTGGSPGSRVAVFVFQLPQFPVDVPSAVISSVTFSFTVSSVVGSQPYGIDLYGLPARSSPTVLGDTVDKTEANDNFIGADDHVDAEKISEDLLVFGQAAPTTINVTNAALRTYVSGQYGTLGENAGKYVFLRLNPDVDAVAASNSGVNVVMAGTSGEPLSLADGRPSLTIEFTPAAVQVPEPAGLGMFGAFIIFSVGRRRR